MVAPDRATGTRLTRTPGPITRLEEQLGEGAHVRSVGTLPITMSDEAHAESARFVRYGRWARSRISVVAQSANSPAICE